MELVEELEDEEFDLRDDLVFFGVFLVVLSVLVSGCLNKSFSLSEIFDPVLPLLSSPEFDWTGIFPFEMHALGEEGRDCGFSVVVGFGFFGSVGNEGDSNWRLRFFLNFLVSVNKGVF